jgi:hypothetical protein
MCLARNSAAVCPGSNTHLAMPSSHAADALAIIGCPAVAGHAVTEMRLAAEGLQP